ncbi:MAG: YebC/PmpR family DNA-binding transcriptional regulator, partial [Candidatus Marinimicrobia bacterium CG_4_10_14_0_2_um_filter_48_9]
STIKRKKAIVDAERGKIFTKLAKEITVAARIGGGDDQTNPRLRTAVLAARGANMPTANVERAIKKGTGELEGVTYEELTYEGYGPYGVALIIEAMTDNKNRTVSEIRHLLGKYGGNLGSSGSVAWMFDTKGIITVKAEGLDEEEVLLASVEAGAEDFSRDEDIFEITTAMSDLHTVSQKLAEAGFTIEDAEVRKIPNNFAELEQQNV